MIVVKIIPQELVEVSAELSVVVIEPDPMETYTGPYLATPKTSEQKLYTKDKAMEDDVTIFSIPFSKTTNLSGGYTANIGG